MSQQAVAETVWEILKRPRHRERWEAWSRPNAVAKRSSDEVDGAQSAIAWVVEDHRDERARNLWEEPNSSPSSRSAVQRFFSQGARPLARFDGTGPIEGCTRSRVLIAIVNAFEFDESEVADVRRAFSKEAKSDDWHMGHNLHAWEIARSDDDLRGVIQLSRQAIGGSAGFKPATDEQSTVDDIAPLRARLDVRADALELCLRHALDDNYETLVGYLLAYPLDASATAAILSGKASSADQFNDNQVATTFDEEDSLYIGMVLGADLPARASVMERCIQRTTRWAAAHADGHVFAKRSTSDGERWLENYGFVPVADREGIWLRDPSAPTARRRKRRLIAAAS